MSHKEANHSSHAQFGTGEEAKGWSPRAHAQPGTLSHTLQNLLPCPQGEDEKSHHSEENGYCGIQAEHLQTAESNSFHEAYNYLVELTVTGYGKG